MDHVSISSVTVAQLVCGGETGAQVAKEALCLLVSLRHCPHVGSVMGFLRLRSIIRKSIDLNSLVGSRYSCIT